MPKYKKKITRLMDYDEFSASIDSLAIGRQAFLSILFFAGVRVSEALALTSNDIDCTKDTIYIQFFRLKGSKPTDPVPVPRTDALNWLCGQDGKLFPFSRSTANRIVEKAFPDPKLYPHYFRQNRFTLIAERFPLATVVSFSGLNPSSVKHYLAKVDIKRVGKALHAEIQGRK